MARRYRLEYRMRKMKKEKERELREKKEKSPLQELLLLFWELHF